MKLFYAESSPYARKVLVTLLETGQWSDVSLESVYGTPLDPGNIPIQQNPLGKLPTLIDPDGNALYDSRVITRFLDERARAGLYPNGPRLWDSLVIESTADGILDSALQIVYEKRLRPAEMQSDDIMQGYRTKITRAVGQLETHWTQHLNDRLDIGQIAVGCALGYLDFRLPDLRWQAAAPRLATWFKTFSTRDSMKQTAPKDAA